MPRVFHDCASKYCNWSPEEEDGSKNWGIWTAVSWDGMGKWMVNGLTEKILSLNTCS